MADEKKQEQITKQLEIGEYGCQLEDDRDLEFSALYDQIDQIPPEYKNLSNEEITEKCNNAIASLYKNRKENCEIAFGVKTDDEPSDFIK